MGVVDGGTATMYGGKGKDGFALFSNSYVVVKDFEDRYDRISIDALAKPGMSPVEVML